MKSFLASSILLFSSALAAHADIIVGLPADVGTGTAWPFSLDFQGEYQQVYTHSVFPGPFLITGLEFFNTAYNSGATSLESGPVTIALSETSVDWNTIGPVLSANIGVNNVQVFNGTIGGPWAFGDTLTFPFSSPYLYDPAAGNLLMDVIANLSGNEAVDFDSNGLNGFGLNGNTIMGRAGLPFPGGFIFVDHGYGLVTGFMGSPVPEPSSLLLLSSIVCVGSAYIVRRRRKSRSI